MLYKKMPIEEQRKVWNNLNRKIRKALREGGLCPDRVESMRGMNSFYVGYGIKNYNKTLKALNTKFGTPVKYTHDPRGVICGVIYETGNKYIPKMYLEGGKEVNTFVEYCYM